MLLWEGGLTLPHARILTAVSSQGIPVVGQMGEAGSNVSNRGFKRTRGLFAIKGSPYVRCFSQSSLAGDLKKGFRRRSRPSRIPLSLCLKTHSSRPFLRKC